MNLTLILRGIGQGKGGGGKRILFFPGDLEQDAGGSLWKPFGAIKIPNGGEKKKERAEGNIVSES